jgi:hypothetical protein
MSINQTHGGQRALVLKLLGPDLISTWWAVKMEHTGPLYMLYKDDGTVDPAYWTGDTLSLV